jgi:osmoprotectant transport system ATP-binding protein
MRARQDRRRDVSDVPLAALRHGIGYVIQSIGLFPHMNVAENIGIVPRLMGQGAADRAAELLELVALPRKWRRATRASFPAARRSGSASPGRWRRGRS